MGRNKKEPTKLVRLTIEAIEVLTLRAGAMNISDYIVGLLGDESGRHRVSSISNELLQRPATPVESFHVPAKPKPATSIVKTVADADKVLKEKAKIEKQPEPSGGQLLDDKGLPYNLIVMGNGRKVRQYAAKTDWGNSPG